MIKIWTSTSQTKVYEALSPILKHNLDIPITVSPDFDPDPAIKLIVAMGPMPVEAMGQMGIVPKKRTVASLRAPSAPFYTASVPTLVTYDAGIGNVDHGWFVDMLTDFASAVRLYRTGSLKPKIGKYVWVNDYSALIETIKARFAATGQPVDLTFDMETCGDDPHKLPTKTHPGGYIISTQITITKGESQCLFFASRGDEHEALCHFIGDQLRWILNSPMVKVRGSNLKYDLVYLAVRTQETPKGAIECTRFTFDSTLVGSLLDENRSNSLKVHTKVYVPELGGYDDEFDEKTDKSRMDLVPKDTLLPYAGGDTDASHQVADSLKEEIGKDQKLAGFYVNILHPAARAFEAIERTGVYLSKEKFHELGADLKQQISSLNETAKKILGGRIVAKHYDDTKLGGLNLTKPSLLKDFMFSKMGLNLKPRMFTEGSQKKYPDDPSQWEPSTSIDHILMFKDDEKAGEFATVFEAFSSANKTHGTYYEGFLEHLRDDGRFHPTYFLYKGDKQEKNEGGTNTGRLSAKDPAFQTIPKHTTWGKRIRECFVAPPGYLVMERDYSQGELRVVACIANEPTMIAAYKANMDLHSETAGPFRGYDYAGMMALKKADKALFDSIRQLGKAGNFGLLYGMGWEGFQIYARENYGVVLTDAEAQAFRNAFLAKYSNLVEYHKEYKAFAKRFEYVRGPLGRVRHLPLIRSYIREIAAKAERQAINSPVQGCLSDMLLWAMAIEHSMGLTKVSPCFGSIHDAAYNYVPEEIAEKVAMEHRDIMENLPFHKVGWNPQLKFIADAKIGPDMAHLVEVKAA